ncbi:MAG: hypothetical protein ACFE0P_14355 [Oceanicaulis sp.]
MSDENDPASKKDPAGWTAGFSAGAAVIVFLFTWVVFDNFALAFLFALAAGAAGAGAARLKS